MDLTGEVAALVAAMAFSIASTLYTLSGRTFDPALVNRTSMPLSLVCLLALHWLTTGQPLPLDADPARWLWMGASGIVGFWLVFLLLMNAFMRIGPRLALLINALGPMLSALLAWVFLGEALEAAAWLGIVLTLGGIAWVVSDGAPLNGGDAPPAGASPPGYRAGVLFALGAAVGQAISFVIARPGLAGDFEPLSGSLMRIVVATAAIWLVTVMRGQVGSSLRTLREHPRALRQLSVASLSGPVIGASLVLVALQHAEVGVASTLANLTPIFLIPIGYVVFHEQITRRAILGTGVAVIGTAILFL